MNVAAICESCRLCKGLTGRRSKLIEKSTNSVKINETDSKTKLMIFSRIDLVYFLDNPSDFSNQIPSNSDFTFTVKCENSNSLSHAQCRPFSFAIFYLYDEIYISLKAAEELFDEKIENHVEYDGGTTIFYVDHL